MRLHLLFLTLFLTGLLALTEWTGAQEEVGSGGETAVSPNPFIAPPDTDSLKITVWEQPEATTLSELILSPMADAAADFCALATPLTLTPLGVPAASQTNVAGFTNSPDDPPLSCAWGSNPPSQAGYRTAWHRFTPAYNGMVTVSTITSEYDTILGVFTGACGVDLQLVSCNDDSLGFTSEVTFPVRRGVIYYVLVGDWQLGALSSPLQLNLQASYDTPLVSEWSLAGFINEPRTRHATAVVGADIYVLGGQTSGGALSNSFARYHTPNDSWTALNPIPGGIMNATAVYLPATQRIYVPGGTIGVNDTGNSSAHWVYSLGNGAWSQAAAVPGTPLAYAATVPHDGGYYLLGGVEGPGWPVTAVITGTVRNEVLFYQAGSNTWSNSSPMGSARYGHTAAAVGGRLCVAGGLTLTENNGVIGFASPIAECASLSNPNDWGTTGPMNVPRYFAHSAVGPDGRWYVYGGLDGTGNAVPEVEVYDPVSNTWRLLTFVYDLNGRQPGDPPVIWPRGGFVGDQLWALGGHFLIGNTQQLNPSIKRMNSPKQGALYLPLIVGRPADNFTLATAQPIAIDQVVSQSIPSVQERYRFYELNMTVGSNLQIELVVPDSEDLDLYLYNDNKVIWGQSSSPFTGGYERICLNSLQPGRYFVAVERPLSPLPPTPDRSFFLLARTVSLCP
jgi:hypothetical protein